MEQLFEQAESIEVANVGAAIDTYNKIFVSDAASAKLKEQSIYKIGKLYAQSGRASELNTLLRSIRPFFETIPKATTAKIVRSLIDLVAGVPGTERQQIELCKESIQWCKETDRAYLRHRIEAKLYALQLRVGEYAAALAGVTSLVWEVKRLDDKPQLVEIQLCESRIHHALRNLPKSRAALTSARTNANAIYCPPKLQADIDMQSGVLHAEEKDYKTAYSYFYEAFEGLSSLDDPQAVLALKYMLLCKIMTNNAEDVQAILNGKTALRYAGREVDAMRAVASAHSARSLHAFESAIKEYSAELSQDPIIHAHLSELYNTLLEQNLCRIIEPFSCVEIAHVASLIQLPVATVEKKLSQMILDKKFAGILDQGLGTLVVFDDPSTDKTYTASLEAIGTLSKIVDSLYEKASKLS